MQDTSENTKRLAKNTLMLYGRMLFGMLVSLYTSRIILAALGENDYGIYNVVGGVVSMFSMVSGALSTSISRFQAYELGRGDLSRLKNAYSASIFIQIAIALLAIIFVETVGVWFLNNKMTIPPERMHAARIVLQCSLITFCSSLLIVPYRASIVAHERMGVFAIISIVEVILKFLIALFLAYSGYPGDKLIMYAALLVSATLLIQFCFSYYCRRNFDECRAFRVTDKAAFKEILSFAGWNFFGTGANVLNGQGINIVLNMIYGPAINAARGLANTVTNILANFVNNFTIALDPQLVKSYGASDLGYMHSLVFRGAKFTFFIFLFIGLPVLLETEFIIGLWLVEIPDHTVNFIRLIMMITFVDLLSNTLQASQIATGKIKYFQIATSTVLLLNFFATYFLLKRGLSPEYCYIIGLMIPVGNLFIRLYCAKKYIKLDLKKYLKNSILLVLLVFVISSVIPLFIRMTMNPGWGRFLLVGFISVLCSSLSILYVGCNANERTFILNSIIKIFQKFKLNRAE